MLKRYSHDVIDHLDDLIVALTMVSFILFSSVTWLKALTLIISVIYLIKTSRLILVSYWVPLFLLMAIQLVVHSTALYSDGVLDITLNRFLVPVLVSGIPVMIYSVSPQITQRSRKVAWIFVLTLECITLLYLPNWLMSGQWLTYRFDGESVLGLTYYSANLLSYIAFVGHGLLLWLVPSFADKRSWLHVSFLIMGYYSQSRAYYVFLGLILLWIFVNRLHSRWNGKFFKSPVVLGFLGGLASLLVAVILIRLNPAWQNAVFIWANNIPPLSLMGRFASLIRLVAGEAVILDASTLERIHLIESGLSLWLKNPLFGIGFSGFSHLAPTLFSEGILVLTSAYTHIDVLEIAVSSGVIGLALYLSAYRHLVNYNRLPRTLWFLWATSMVFGLIFRQYFDKQIWWFLIAILTLSVTRQEASE